MKWYDRYRVVIVILVGFAVTAAILLGIPWLNTGYERYLDWQYCASHSELQRDSRSECYDEERGQAERRAEKERIAKGWQEFCSNPKTTDNQRHVYCPREAS